MAEDLIAGIGVYVALRRTPGGARGLCPFHQEATPSFVVVSSRWHCFGCGARGTTLDEFRRAWKACAGEDR